MEYGHLYCTDPSNAEWLKNISFTVLHATSDPLVNVYRSMGNQHIQWVNQRTEWQFSIAKYEFTQGIFFQNKDPPVMEFHTPTPCGNRPIVPLDLLMNHD